MWAVSCTKWARFWNLLQSGRFIINGGSCLQHPMLVASFLDINHYFQVIIVLLAVFGELQLCLSSGILAAQSSHTTSRWQFWQVSCFHVAIKRKLQTLVSLEIKLMASPLFSHSCIGKNTLWVRIQWILFHCLFHASLASSITPKVGGGYSLEDGYSFTTL